MPRELPKAYDPAAIEDRWAEYWVKERLFDTKAEDVGKSAAHPFTILLPPPNVTGRLHMGHMFEQTEMDIIIRWHRMLGDLALWVPGTDHAGIATQLMVERQLAEEGKTRQQTWPRGFPRTRLAMETTLWRRDPRPDEAARRERRLVARIFHHERGALGRGERGVRPPA